MNFGILLYQQKSTFLLQKYIILKQIATIFHKKFNFPSLLFFTIIKHRLENSLISMPYFEDWQIVGVCNRLHLENKFFQRQERNMWNFYS